MSTTFILSNVAYMMFISITLIVTAINYFENSKLQMGETPLQRVCYYKEKHSERRSEIVQLLLDHDAKLNIEDKVRYCLAKLEIS